MTEPAIPSLLAEARSRQASGAPDAADRIYEQVLSLRPDHAGAWLARIELALSRGTAALALEQCETALPRCPGHRVALLTKRARALEMEGARDAALTLLSELRAEAPDDLPLIAAMAGMLLRAGASHEAEHAYRRVLALRSDHAGAWLALVEIALTRGAAGQALAMTREAEAHCPAQAPQLQIKRLRALEALGQAEAALALTVTLRETQPGNALLALTEARIRRRAGDLVAAENAYRDVLEHQPDHVGAWLGLIDIARAAGDPDRALDLVTAALAQRPGDPALIAMQAGLFLHMDQTETAIGLLTAALEATPGDGRLQLELARARMQAGQAAEAETLFAACLAAAPGNDAVRLDLAQAQVMRGASQAALATLESHAARSPTLGLKTAEIMAQTGQGDRAALLDRLAAEAPQMTEPELLRLFRLGEQSDHSAAAVAVIENIAARDALSPLIARFLLGRARVILPSDEQVAGLRSRLAARLPASRRPEFDAYATALLDGPEAALMQVRAGLPPRRDTQGAILLAERLLDSGRAQSGFRYLRACVRRWPGAPRLRRQFLRAAIETGRLGAGHSWLDSLETRFPGQDLGLDRIHLMVQEGRLEDVRDMAEARVRAGRRALPTRQYLDVTLALGDVEKSTELADQLRLEPGAGRQNAAHFSTTLQGAQLNELRLYRATEAHALGAGEAPGAARARLAENFFYPAATIIADHLDRVPPRPGAGGIPKRVFQYWNSPQVPEEVAALSQSWQAARGFEYRMLDRRAGLAFLREAFGARHARAFQLANSPAEECDFLRLCLLYKYGGIYADADDKLTGSAEGLIAEGPGLIVTRELWGALANNVICAPAGHPVLLWALRAAGRSLLARENDGTWFKTGPGLLTRAVAVWLEQAPAKESAEGLTVLTQAQLADYVQPHVRLSYKSSGQYWNARDRHAPQPLIAALSSLAVPSAALS